MARAMWCKDDRIKVVGAPQPARTHQLHGHAPIDTLVRIICPSRGRHVAIGTGPGLVRHSVCITRHARARMLLVCI